MLENPVVFLSTSVASFAAIGVIYRFGILIGFLLYYLFEGNCE